MPDINSQTLPEISIVVPLYNEEDGFPFLVDRLTKLLDSSNRNIEVVWINDGSRDNTPLLMMKKSLEDKRFTSVFLSRNHGHQLALTAGMAQVRATKAVMIIDGDLQDPPELMESLYSKIEEGYEVVFAVRKKRKDGYLKRKTAWLYYRTLQSISNVEVQLDSGDFCMLSRRVVDVMNKMPETSRFLRGMRSWIGFKQIGVEYDRDSRVAGETKYPFKKMLEFAYNGIFSFSDFPVKVITRLGIFSVVISAIYMVYVLIKKIYFGGVADGFTTLIFAISMFSGSILLCLGFIGEYVLRIYNEVRNRPLFIIDKVVRNGEEEQAPLG